MPDSRKRGIKKSKELESFLRSLGTITGRLYLLLPNSFASAERFSLAPLVKVFSLQISLPSYQPEQPLGLTRKSPGPGLVLSTQVTSLNRRHKHCYHSSDWPKIIFSYLETPSIPFTPSLNNHTLTLDPYLLHSQACQASQECCTCHSRRSLACMHACGLHILDYSFTFTFPHFHISSIVRACASNRRKDSIENVIALSNSPSSSLFFFFNES